MFIRLSEAKKSPQITSRGLKPKQTMKTNRSKINSFIVLDHLLFDGCSQQNCRFHQIQRKRSRDSIY